MENIKLFNRGLKQKVYWYLAKLAIAQRTLWRGSKHNTAIVKMGGVLHVNTFDQGGGAAKVAVDLLQVQQENGLISKLLVGTKKGGRKDVLQAQYEGGVSSRIKNKVEQVTHFQGIFSPSMKPYLRRILQKEKISVVHLHNLHGQPGYFALTDLLRTDPGLKLIWTLHDMQALTGHCAHSFSCERWKEQCGSCPALDAYPALAIDVTQELRSIKAQIYRQLKVQIVTPSDWLNKMAKQSILGHFPIVTIPNGVDEKVYTPLGSIESRRALGISLTSKVVLFTAEFGTENPYKGGRFVKSLAEQYVDQDISFVCLGSNQERKEINVTYLPYVEDREVLVRWYSAADVLLYPSLADNCPLVVLEAMACGLPVLSFNTGGIPELVQHLETGYIAKYEDAGDLQKGFELILSPGNRVKMGSKARERVLSHFTLDRMNESYLKLYHE